MKFIYIAMLAMSLTSCFGGNSKTNSASDVNPLWGLWVQMYPDTEAKSEIMFNDDCTGFLFIADTLVAETIWEQSDVVSVRFSSSVNSTLHGIERIYDVQIDADTLSLIDKTTGLETNYLRVTN